MSNEPTIIVGKINDKQLKDSIDKLVQHVAKGTSDMVKDFDKSINQMKEKLKELGKTKVEIGGTSGASSTSKSTRKRKEETQATKELKITLDQTTTSLKEFYSAQQVQQAKRFNVSDIQQYRMQLHELEAQMKKISAPSFTTYTNKKIGGRFDITDAKQYETLITNIEQRIEKLKTARTGFVNARDAESAQRITQEIKTWESELTKIKQQRGIWEQQQKSLLALTTSYEQIKTKIREMAIAMGWVDESTKHATTSAGRYASEVERIAAEVRKTTQWQKVDMMGGRSGMANINGRAMPVIENLELGIRLEDSIAEAIKRVNAERERGVAITREQSEADKKAAEELGWIKRKNTYAAPITETKSYSEIRAAVQSLTHSQAKWVDEINKSNAAYTQLAQHAKDLKQIYMTTAPTAENQKHLRVLADEIQATERAMQKLNAQMSRPSSLAQVMALPTKTLDDMAYKMRQLSAYRFGLDVNKQRNEINQVNAAYDRLKKKMDEVMQKNNQMMSSNNALTRSWNYMKNRLAFYFTVGASTSFIKNLIQVRSEYEMNERALGILINSAERGTQIFNELSQMALVSPYTLIELSTAAKQLTAYDVAAKDVVDTTRRLADISAAVGVPVERFTYALGQVKAFGHLTSQDARQFLNTGVPLVKELAKYYTEIEGRLVSTADVYDRMKKHAVSYNDVLLVLNKLTDEGGKFFDFQEKMAGTLKVQLANLTLAWNNMLNDIGESQQGVLTTGIGALRSLFAHWKDIYKAINNVLIPFGILKAMQLAYWALTKNTIMAMGLQTVVGNRLALALRNVGLSLKKIVTTRTTWFGLLGMAIASAISEVVRGNEAMREFNKTLSEGAADGYKNITEYLEQAKRIKDSLYEYETDNKGVIIEKTNKPKDINNDEAKKAWEEMRENIELTTTASDYFIGNLLKIENVSQRLREGFGLLESMQKLDAAIKDMNNDTLALTKDWSAWWNLWTLPDGLLENLKDYQDQMRKISKEKEESFQQSAFASGIDYETQKLQAQSIALEKLQNDFNKTAESIESFINHQGFADDPDAIIEAYNKIIKQIAPDPESEYALQKAAEKRKADAVREALAARIEEEERKWAESTNRKEMYEIEARINSLKEQQKIYDKSLDDSRFYWNDFTKYMKERHISEMQKMFGAMTDEHDRNVYMQSVEWNNAVDSWVKGYARAHKMSYDEAFGYLKNWVKNANLWNIFIKLTISTDDGKSLFEQLSGFDSTIDTADKKIKRLDERISQLREKTNKTKKDEDELAKALTERADAQKEKDEAIEKGGKSAQDEKQAEKDARASAAAARKQAAADRKAQKEAETELQKAFKDELQLIDKVRSQYKKLTDSNVKGGDALNMVTTQFENSIENINKVLGKNGLPLFDISTFAGTDNPSKLLELLDSQLKAAKGAKNVKPAELKELEIKIGDLIIDAKVYNTKKIVDGLNNELNKLKEDYEIALELDANPELGDIFSDILGIQNYALPQTFGDLLDEANKVARKKLKELGVNNENFDLLSSLIIPDANNKYFGLEMESDIVKALVSAQKSYRDMFKKNITDSEKMLDDYVKKYGDYSDKIAEIEADKQKKLKELDNAYPISQRMRPEYTAKRNAIEQGALRELGQAQFDEFKNSQLYVTMFENLQTVSKATLVAIRQKLVELKDELGTLSPEQLKQVTQQFEKIDQELVRRNPFKNLVKNVKDYAKAIGKEGKKAQSDFLKAQESYDAQLKVVAALKQQLEEKKALEDGDKEGLQTLMERISSEEIILAILKKQLDEAEALNEQYNLMRKAFKDNADSISKLIGVIADNLQSLKEFRDYMQETFGIDMGNNINAIIDDLAGVGEGLNQITSSAQSGNVFGVITGTVKAVSGLGDAVASIFGDGAARTKRLNKEIEKSAAEVWRLNYAYKELERSVNKSLGGAEIHARRLAIANKEAELAEEERQLALEKRKRGKDKDNDAIKQSQEKIQDLRHEIADLKDEIVTNLLGSDVKAAAEEFVDTWVQAWKAGEVTLDAIEEKMNDMIYNLIKKAATSKIVANILKPLYDAIDEYTKAESRGGEELTADEIKDLSSLSESLSAKINDALGAYYGNMKAIGALPDAGKNLSALQQGIQSITEDTAGALEAYMNSVSQQVYLHSDLLTQIRDTVTSFNLDVQVATIGQILMQLQSSYQVQMAIQGIMEGWTTPNGMAVRVELNS